MVVVVEVFVDPGAVLVVDVNFVVEQLEADVCIAFVGFVMGEIVEVVSGLNSHDGI